MNKNEIDDAQDLIQRFFREAFHADCFVWVQARGYVHVWMKTPAMVRLATDWEKRDQGGSSDEQAEAA